MMDIQQMMQDRFGFSEFRAGQKTVLDALCSGQSALAVFPTGGGKSICYQLPALIFDGMTLVVSPLIALMKDQIDFLTARGIPAARLDSSLSASEYFEIMDRLRSGELKLLYVAPERFTNERFISMLKKLKISLFAVDEAHCISEWGHNFRPDYLKLAEFAHQSNAERILALTATATPSVVKDICTGFQISPQNAIVTGFYRPNLLICITPASLETRDSLLIQRISSRKPGPTIVYVTLQKTAEQVAQLLQEAGFPAKAYHAGMDSLEREEIQNWWTQSDRAIVVATIAFGMGIDKATVRYIYHYNLPKSLENYSQEIGRAGRDGENSIVELLACPDDVPVLENFTYGDTPTETALQNMLDEVLNQGDEFDLNPYDLSTRHDIRQLVLRTALTYLELEGILKQGTSFYAGYEFRPLVPIPEIFAVFPGEPGRFVADLFGMAKKGRTWYSMNPELIAQELGQERRRVVRALEVLEERQLIELRSSDVRRRYQRMRYVGSLESLASMLVERFRKREELEILRLQQVLSFATHEGCLTNHLVQYFGETRTQPCGHCSFCRTQQAVELPPARILPAVFDQINAQELLQLRIEQPQALSDPRQMARFLCGLSSPALTKAKLTRTPLFGALEAYHFSDVMKWCQELIGVG